jgi:uncharacterized RDD family membrane protein YckC
MKFFNRFTLQTPESVELEFTLAGIGNRVYALLIDYLCLGIILLIFLVIWWIFYFQLSELIRYFSFGRDIFLWVLAIQIFIMFFTYMGYFVFFETLWQGQTPGKRWVKIRVICDDGRPVGIQQATLRAILRPVDEISFLGAFLIMFSSREKRLGDLFAGTIVIEESQGKNSGQIDLSNAAKVVAKQLQIDADLSRLLPEHFAVIREYLQRRKEMLSEAKYDLARKLAKQVKEMISLEHFPEGITPNIFLEAIYLAYQQRNE